MKVFWRHSEKGGSKLKNRTNRGKKNKYDNSEKILPVQPEQFMGDVPLKIRLTQKHGESLEVDLTFLAEGFNTIANGRKSVRDPEPGVCVPRSQLAQAFARALEAIRRKQSAVYVENLFYQIKHFKRFLDTHYPQNRIDRQEQINDSLFTEFAAYLRGLKIKNISRWSIFKKVKNLCGTMRDLDPKLMPGFVNPQNPFSYKVEVNTDKVIAADDFKTIFRHMKEQTTAIMENYKKAGEWLKATEHLSVGCARSPEFWGDPANVLHYLVREVGLGAAIPRDEMRDYKIKRNGLSSCREILAYYIPVGMDGNIPMQFFLTFYTAMNVDSMLALSRECMREDVWPGLSVIDWTKPRAGERSNKRSIVTSRAELPVPLIVKFLLEYTQPLVRLAQSEYRDRLLLLRRERGPGLHVGVFPPKSGTFCVAVQRYIKKYNLPEFNFNQLRSTAACVVYMLSEDKNYVSRYKRVQQLLCHESLEQTVHYLDQINVRRWEAEYIQSGILDLLHRAGIRKFEERKAEVIVATIEEAVENSVEDGTLSQKEGERILKRQTITMFGPCRNPFKSPYYPEGVLCKLLHGCLFCENAMIFPENLLALVRFRNGMLAEKATTSERDWREKHGRAITAIAEVMTDFVERGWADMVEQVEEFLCEENEDEADRCWEEQCRKKREEIRNYGMGSYTT